MRVLLRNGFEEIEILSRDHLIEPRTEEAVMALLGSLVANPLNLDALRRALPNPLTQSDDRSLLRKVAQQILAGRLRLIRRRRFEEIPPTGAAADRSTPREDELTARQSQKASGSTARPAPAPAAAVEEDPLLAGIDPASQAATLAAAAASGAPLCDT